MKNKNRSVTVASVLALGIFISFGIWYRGPQSPLSAQEIEAYLKRIEANQSATEEPFDSKGLRDFFEQDDGAPFYVVNLIQFHKYAQYPDQAETQITGVEAADRFNAAVIPELLKRGSHPTFGGSGVHATYDKWDQVGIVRYRSRRDLADLFASDEFSAASVHRNAGIKKRIHLPIQAVNLPSPFTPLFFLLVLTLTLIVVISHWRKEN